MKSIHSIRLGINHIRLLSLMSHVTFSGSKRSISKSKQQTVLIHTHSVLCYLHTETLPGHTVIHMFRINKILGSGTARDFSVHCELLKAWLKGVLLIVLINGYWDQILTWNRVEIPALLVQWYCTTVIVILHNSSFTLLCSGVWGRIGSWVTCWLWGQKGWVVSFCLCWMVFSCSSPFLSSTATLMELTWHLFLWWPLTPSAPPTLPQLWELFTFFTPSPTSSAHLSEVSKFSTLYLTECYVN